MPRGTHMNYEEREATTTRWVTIFVVLSILAHLVIIGAVIFITKILPAPRIKLPPLNSPTVTISLLPSPPPQEKVMQPPPPNKPMFMPSTPDEGAKPNPNAPFESDNNHRLMSENQKPRTPDSIMPDVTGDKMRPDLNNKPQVNSPPKPEVSSTPPVPKPQPQKQPLPTPSSNPSETQAIKPPPQPAKPTKEPPPPKPDKSDVDPLTGLPILPPIDAQTMAPQSTTPPSVLQKPEVGAPPQSFAVAKADIEGSAGVQGENSAETRETPLGRYKAKVYRAVGSRWHYKIAAAASLISVGGVRIQYTISADGTITTKVLDSGSPALQNLLSASLNSLLESAPFDKFDDYPGMREELIKEEGGDGSSYTSDFTFQVY